MLNTIFSYQNYSLHSLFLFVYEIFMPSPAQIRAARAMLNWSREDLADASGLSADSIFKIEKGTVQARGKTSDQLSRSFMLQGIIFTDNDGVQRQSTDIQVYKGREGFVQWADDVYQDRQGWRRYRDQRMP